MFCSHRTPHTKHTLTPFGESRLSTSVGGKKKKDNNDFNLVIDFNTNLLVAQQSII